MPKKKAAPAQRPLLVVPPPPTNEVPGATVRAKSAGTRKKPLDPREFPAARDSRGTATREQIRRETPPRFAPRQGPAGKRGQPKSGK